MLLNDLPIQKRLMRGIALISVIKLLIICGLFFAFGFYTFRETTLEKLSTLGKVIAVNSTAALAFDNQEDAKDILTALKAESHIVAACLYDKKGNLFAHYPADLDVDVFPVGPGAEGYAFHNTSLEGFQPVMQEERQLGTLYLKSDLDAMYEALRLFGVVTMVVFGISFLLAYMLSKTLQESISTPILALAEIAKVISTEHDYSVRAVKQSNDEIGSLTDAFNLMLVQIQEQNKALAEFNQNLEDKVKERTNDMQIANKELESFAYSVSHDLRAPLRAIHSYSKILEEDYMAKLDEDGKRTIGVILRNAKRMGELIDDLLAFSRLGRQEINSRDIQMNTLVKGITDEVLSSAASAGKVEIVIHPLPPAAGDQALIKQVWINLISNAVKYSGKKEKILIEIGSYPSEDQLVYYVKDNGAGFDMKYYDKLFGVFQRLHSHEEFEGTGVGLAITQRIVAKHHGRVWAESRLNEGATFHFSLRPVQAN